MPICLPPTFVVLDISDSHVDLDRSAVQVVQRLAHEDGSYSLTPRLKVDAEGEWRVIWPEAVEALRALKTGQMAELAAAGSSGPRTRWSS